MKVFIIPLEKFVEVKRMPYVVRHRLFEYGGPRGFTVETVEGPIFEVQRIDDMIFVFDSIAELNKEREQLERYRGKSQEYYRTYERFRSELGMEPNEFMRALPFEKF